MSTACTHPRRSQSRAVRATSDSETPACVEIHTECVEERTTERQVISMWVPTALTHSPTCAECLSSGLLQVQPYHMQTGGDKSAAAPIVAHKLQFNRVIVQLALPYLYPQHQPQRTRKVVQPQQQQTRGYDHQPVHKYAHSRAHISD